MVQPDAVLCYWLGAREERSRNLMEARAPEFPFWTKFLSSRSGSVLTVLTVLTENTENSENTWTDFERFGTDLKSSSERSVRSEVPGALCPQPIS